jgi:hypothetical protein
MELRSGLQLKNHQASRREVGAGACHYLLHPQDLHQAIQGHKVLVQDLKAPHPTLTRVVSFQDHPLHQQDDQDRPLWARFRQHPRVGRTSNLGRGQDHRQRVLSISTLVPRQFVHMSEVHHHLTLKVYRYRQDQLSLHRDRAERYLGRQDVRSVHVAFVNAGVRVVLHANVSSLVIIHGRKIWRLHPRSLLIWN